MVVFFLQYWSSNYPPFIIINDPSALKNMTHLIKDGKHGEVHSMIETLLPYQINRILMGPYIKYIWQMMIKSIGGINYVLFILDGLYSTSLSGLHCHVFIKWVYSYLLSNDQWNHAFHHLRACLDAFFVHEKWLFAAQEKNHVWLSNKIPCSRDSPWSTGTPRARKGIVDRTHT